MQPLPLAVGVPLAVATGLSMGAVALEDGDGTPPPLAAAVVGATTMGAAGGAPPATTTTVVTVTVGALDGPALGTDAVALTVGAVLVVAPVNPIDGEDPARGGPAGPGLWPNAKASATTVAVATPAPVAAVPNQCLRAGSSSAISAAAPTSSTRCMPWRLSGGMPSGSGSGSGVIARIAVPCAAWRFSMRRWPATRRMPMPVKVHPNKRIIVIITVPTHSVYRSPGWRTLTRSGERVAGGRSRDPVFSEG